MSKLIILVMVLLTSFKLLPHTWQIEQGTKVNFSLDGMLWTETKGTLDFATAIIKFDPTDLSKSNMDVSLSVYSINTQNSKRDDHLKNKDFFDATKYPTIVFTSVSFKKVTENTYTVTGNLTMKAVTKSVTIPFTFSQSGNKGEFKGSFKLNRMDFDVGTGYKIGIGREVRISIHIPVVKL